MILILYGCLNADATVPHIIVIMIARRKTLVNKGQEPGPRTAGDGSDTPSGRTRATSQSFGAVSEVVHRGTAGTATISGVSSAVSSTMKTATALPREEELNSAQDLLGVNTTEG